WIPVLAAFPNQQGVQLAAELSLFVAPESTGAECVALRCGAEEFVAADIEVGQSCLLISQGGRQILEGQTTVERFEDGVQDPAASHHVQSFFRIQAGLQAKDRIGEESVRAGAKAVEAG